MGRAICLCLLASLAVGLAVPVTDLPSPGNEKELMDIIFNAKSEDNDIYGPPARNELPTVSKDNVTLDSAATTEAAVIEEGTQQPSEIVPDAIVRDISTTTEKVVDPAAATNVNSADLPKAPTQLEPEVEYVPLDSEEDQQYPPENLSPEEQTTGEDIFEGDADVISPSEGMLSGNDQIIIIPNEEQEIFEDDDVVVPEEENTQVYGDQIVPEIFEQMTSEEEEEEEEPEVILVLDEKVQLMPTTLEEEQFEGEGDEQPMQVPIDPAQSGEEEIFIIEGGETFPITEEKEENFMPFEDPLTEDDEVPVEDTFMENDRMPAQDPFMAEEQIPGENPFITDEQMPPMIMPEVSMMNKEVIIMPISEESYVPNANEDSVFGSDSFSSYPTGNPDSISTEFDDDLERFFDEDTPFLERPSFDKVPVQASDFPFNTFSGPPKGILENFYIPDVTIENEEISTFPENENDSFIDVGEVVLNEPIPSENDNETPSLVKILMIKAKPSMNNRNPIIEVVSTGVSQIPQQFPFGVPLPMNDDQEQESSEIPERDVDVDILISDSEEQLPERGSLLPPTTLAQQPIIFPEELAAKHNLPVFPNRWNEENFYQTQDIHSQNAVPFEPFTYSSYSRYSSSGIPGNSFGSPLPFNSYGPTQDQSFSGPEPFQQSFEGDQSGDMSGMMNDDMQSQMASTSPLSSASDITSFDTEDMQEDGQPDHFHMTDGVFQNSRFPNVPNRFDSFINSAVPARDDDGTSQDFRGPNTFPLNFRNPNVDRDNMNFNIFDTSFRQDASLRPFQQDQQYGVSASFSPYDSAYSMLPANQPLRFDVRYPAASQSKPFNPYGSYGFGYPSNDNYYPIRTSGLYSPQLMNRYSMNYPFGNFRQFNYPIPRW